MTKTSTLVSLFVLICWTASAQFGGSPWTATSGTYTVPVGVSSITIECRGGGGGGGGARSASGGDAAAGGGGGGAYSITTVNVTPGQTITVAVGAAGASGSNNGGNGGNGGTSTVTYLSNVVAQASGGFGGTGGTSGNKTGGAGGSTGTGTVRLGGNGGNGYIGSSFDFGGGGGGAAGTNTNGGVGTTSNGTPVAPAPGGTGGTVGGGNGGNGYQGLGGSGSAGAAPGGGGGGAASYNGASGSGGAGGAGRVVITYTACTPPATPTTISGTTTICGGSANTYSIAPVSGATSYTWSLPSGWVGTSTSETINTTATLTGGTISVTANDACGSSTPQTLAITVNNIPATPGTILGPTIHCIGITEAYAVTSVSGATSYTWSLTTGWTGTSTTSDINVLASAASGTISVTANNTCGSSSAQTLSLNSLSTPATPGSITSTTSGCVGSVASFSIAPVATATNYAWTLPIGWSGSSSTETISSTVVNPGGTVTVAAENACGSSSAQSTTVNVITAPEAPTSINGDAAVCASSTNTYSITAVSGATDYTWTFTGGWSGTSTTETISATATSSSSTISVTANNTCGSSAAVTLDVDILTVPASPLAILGPDSACEGSNITLSVAPIVDATSYTWTLPGSWTGSSTTESINATVALSSANVTVTANNACGSSADQIKNVIINTLPSVDFGLSVGVVCSNTNPTITLGSGTPAGGTYSGTGVSGTTFDATGLANGNYVLTYTVSNAAGCVNSDTANVGVTVCTGLATTTANSIKVYPNPFSQIIQLTELPQGAAVHISDVSGRIVMSANTATINTTDLAAGYYVLTVLQNEKTVATYSLSKAE